MKIPFILFTLLLSVVLVVHLAMNGEVGARMGNARVANAVFWTIGAITAIIVGLTGYEAGVLGKLRDIPFWLLTAGILGSLLVFAIAWMIPRVGAGTFFAVLISGQVVVGLALSHFGWLTDKAPITKLQLLGGLLLVVGVILVNLNPSKSSGSEDALPDAMEEVAIP